MMKDNHVAGEGNAYYTLFRVRPGLRQMVETGPNFPTLAKPILGI